MFFSTRFPETPLAGVRPSYDYIIVGGGTSGCVLANRLTQDPNVTVLVIERGGVKNSFISRVPLLSSHFASDGSRSHVVKTTPQARLDGRQLEITSGNSLGGASKINAMMYTRGLPAEYESWQAMGNDGWGYKDMLPYFVKTENYSDRTAEDNPAWHGTKGEWPVHSHSRRYWWHTDEIIKACSSMGVPYVNDLNAPYASPHGCTKMYYTFDKWGQRSSTLTALLPASLVRERRDRLHVCTNTVVKRIEVNKSVDNTLAAEGVWIANPAGEGARLVKARREVIVCAGAVFSPHLLMLSGIGPADHLKEHNIPVVKDLPAVGGNLQDHVSVPIQFRIPLFDSLAMLVIRPWIIIKLFFLFLFFGTGLLLSPVLELPIFLQSRLMNNKFETIALSDDSENSKTKNLPDIEIMPVSWADVAQHRQGGLSFFSIPLRPTSRGTIRLRDASPTSAPVVDLNTLATASDRHILRTGLRYSFALKNRMATHGYPIADAKVPEGAEDASDDALDAWAKTEMISANHYTSTCRMAPEHAHAGGDGDELAGGTAGGVVDARLRVYGVKGLRIADASVMPEILSTHLVATVVAIAEKCADMVKDDWALVQTDVLREKVSFKKEAEGGIGRRVIKSSKQIGVHENRMVPERYEL